MSTSAAPAAKRQRTASAGDKYELLYWPGIPGRGEFVRLAFAASKTPFVDVGNETKDGIKEMITLIGSDPNAVGEFNVPPLAPPILRHGEVLLSQTPAILM